MPLGSSEVAVPFCRIRIRRRLGTASSVRRDSARSAKNLACRTSIVAKIPPLGGAASMGRRCGQCVVFLLGLGISRRRGFSQQFFSQFRTFRERTFAATMSKKCAKCDKTVYPLEELKCLDKMWHKACFKCQECGMTLNMRNYKGFNRLPYCTAHCPQAKHTTVADTPEIRRIQENTKIQSTVKYHEEFEKQKGKVTQIADDPETLRIRQNTKIISNVAYHGDLERKAQMEQKRPPNDDRDDEAAAENVVSDEEVLKPAHSANNVHNSVPVVATNQVPVAVAQAYQEPPPPPLNPAPVRVAELDATHAKDSPYSSRQASTVIYTSEHGPVSTPPSRSIGSIADYDPINDNYGSVASATGGQKRMMGGDQRLQQSQRPAGLKFRAMYDYTAADSDEVSFQDGDVIVNCVSVDEGWMTGIVQRTGQKGMLPANYVEPCN